MNIFQRFASLVKQAEVKNPFAVMPKRQFTESFGTTAREQFLQANKSWVFACVQAISQEISNIDLRLLERDDDEFELVTDHPVIELLNRVNPRMTRHELFEITQSHLELDGNAFWLLARNGVNEIREIWPLLSRRDLLSLLRFTPMGFKPYRL